MFEILMLIAFLSIGLSQLLPRQQGRRPERKDSRNIQLKAPATRSMHSSKMAQPRVHHSRTPMRKGSYLLSCR